jgi:hypothetical protein
MADNAQQLREIRYQAARERPAAARSGRCAAPVWRKSDVQGRPQAAMPFTEATYLLRT